ncbi:MAG: prepilin-type N-terminal cleavage/methylation domain-containing protein [Firmicutes bacterium]|nr:prepilin-type N-terminal cleavage/methylation domain-containing protein [Bacillota bacterium]
MKKNREAGFTLLEVLVAVTILGIGLTVLVEGFAAGLAVLQNTRNNSIAIILAEGKLAEVENGLVAGDSGDFAEAGEEYSRFRWTVSTEQGEPGGIRKITVTVSWDSPRGRRSYALSSAMMGE